MLQYISILYYSLASCSLIAVLCQKCECITKIRNYVYGYSEISQEESNKDYPINNLEFDAYNEFIDDNEIDDDKFSNTTVKLQKINEKVIIDFK